MKQPTQIGLVLVIAAGVIFAAGCAAGPEKRIQANPELFDSLESAEQEAVREGRVEVGFSKEMVELALGEPDRRTTRATDDGVAETWEYLGRYTTADTVEIREFARFSRRDTIIVTDRSREEVYTRMSLDFEDGELVAIESLER